MYLPISLKELNFILEILKNKDRTLYNRLWSYKINKLSNMENVNEFS